MTRAGRKQPADRGICRVLASGGCDPTRPTYDRKNSFVKAVQSLSGISALTLSTATPPSCAKAPTIAGILRCRRLADSSVHHRARDPLRRLRKLILASGD